jgi:hypothetical protein
VGEAVGFGGNAIRTVSVFGCTLAASGGLGAPPGGTGEFGVGSAINDCADNVWVGKNSVKSLLLTGRRLRL